MGIKLQSALKSPILQLAFKSALVGLGFFYSLWLGWLIAGWFYFRPSFNSSAFLSLFALFLFLSFMDPYLLVLIILSVLFGILLGLKNMVLVNRQLWRSVLIFSLFYLSFLEFYEIGNFLFPLKWLLFVFIVWLLFVELFKGFLDQPHRVLSLTSALIIGELMWIINWLPIGFLSSANITILAVFLIADLAAYYYRKKLSQKLIIKGIVLFFILLILVLLTSFCCGPFMLRNY